MNDWPVDSPIAAPAPATTIVPADVLAEATADAAQMASPAGATAAPSSTAPTVAAIVDYDAEARDIVAFAYAMFAPIYPSLEAIYTVDARARIVAAAAPLMRKYAFTLGVVGPELMFVIAVAPLIVPTMKAVKHDNEKARQEASRAEAAKHGRPIGEGVVAAPAAAAVVDAGADDRSPLAAFPDASARA
jgi:hypothetical protein